MDKKRLGELAVKLYEHSREATSQANYQILRETIDEVDNLGEGNDELKPTLNVARGYTMLYACVMVVAKNADEWAMVCMPTPVENEWKSVRADGFVFDKDRPRASCFFPTADDETALEAEEVEKPTAPIEIMNWQMVNTYDGHTKDYGKFYLKSFASDPLFELFAKDMDTSYKFMAKLVELHDLSQTRLAAGQFREFEPSQASLKETSIVFDFAKGFLAITSPEPMTPDSHQFFTDVFVKSISKYAPLRPLLGACKQNSAFVIKEAETIKFASSELSCQKAYYEYKPMVLDGTATEEVTDTIIGRWGEFQKMRPPAWESLVVPLVTLLVERLDDLLTLQYNTSSGTVDCVLKLRSAIESIEALQVGVETDFFGTQLADKMKSVLESATNMATKYEAEAAIHEFKVMVEDTTEKGTNFWRSAQVIRTMEVVTDTKALPLRSMCERLIKEATLVVPRVPRFASRILWSVNRNKT